MFRKNLIIFIVVFALAAGAYYLLTKKTEQTSMPTYLQDTTESMWVPYTSDDNFFSGFFPEIPEVTRTNQPFDSANETVTYKIYTAVGRDGTKYMLSMATYPDSANLSNTPLLLQTLLKQMATGSQPNDIIGQRMITFQGYPAMDFDLQNNKVATLGRAIIVNKSLLVLLVINQNRDFLEKHFRKFADSLKIQSEG